jgi:polyhydroxyalkanoate synthase
VLGLPSLTSVVSTAIAAAGNVADKMRSGRLADLRPMPRQLVDHTSRGAVYRYDLPGEPVGAPVLLVPPPAVSGLCYDLRRGCSLVEYLVAQGRPTYLVDTGQITYRDRHIGLDDWLDTIIPNAVNVVSADSGGGGVHVAGWSMAGQLIMLVAADHPDLPIASATVLMSPFDIENTWLQARFRPVANLLGGSVVSAVYRTLGGVPASVVRLGFKISSLDRQLLKPLLVARNLGNREFLAQIEAVDRFSARMLAYPGRLAGQYLHWVFRPDAMTSGVVDLDGRIVELAKVRVPVLSVAGLDDSLASVRSCERLLDLLPDAPSVRFETAPGGHLGALTGRAARDTTWRALAEHLTEHDPGRVALC